MLGALFVTPVSILGGAPANGLVVLNANAKTGGAVVTLNSGSGSITVPATVTVLQGTSQAAFSIASSAVASSTTGTITAKLYGASASSSLTLQPALTSFSVNPTSVPGGAGATLILYLAALAPAGGWPINLSSSSPSVVSVPSTVSIPAGTKYLQVPITSTPQCGSTTVTLTASAGVTVLKAPLTVTPPPVSNLSFASSVKGGNLVTATVSISNPACAQGLSVSLLSANPSVARVPPSVAVAGGQKSATFVITTYHVSTTTTVNISAKSNNVTKSRILTVTP